ncbi:MAG TPA: hypothetical protein VNP36_16340 [Burkholderiales bacterium]|nr:hypothetical protein [Burkholderiales bacterium]
MQPANIAVSLRRRSPWEAMDLGLTMLQRWWRQVYLPYLLVAVPIMSAAIAIAWTFERAWVALALVWWLKPLYDRVVLHVLSRAVFGELQGTRAVLGAWKEWLGTGLFTALTFHRLSFARSFNLPVRQLEGQTGRAARERRAVLGRRVGSYAVWLTIVCFALEIFVLWTSFGLLSQLFVPAKADDGKSVFDLLFGNVDDAGEVFTWEDAFAYPLAVLVLEPFYVAAGFALYLNRRTLLEGWDIEVALRRIAQRHAAAVLFMIFSVVTFLPAPPVHAQEKDAKTEISEVLKAKEFGYYKEVKRWEPRARATPSDTDFSWLIALGQALAKAGEVLLWIGAGALIAYALWWAARMLPRRGDPQPEPYQPPAALFGMDLAPEKLPPDVAAAAAALAREGKLREALGLLYRGALSELVHKRGVRLLASHTEGDVLRLSGDRGYLQNLIDAWRRCAYARRMPAATEIEALAAQYGSAFA